MADRFIPAALGGGILAVAVVGTMLYLLGIPFSDRAQFIVAFAGTICAGATLIIAERR